MTPANSILRRRPARLVVTALLLLVFAAGARGQSSVRTGTFAFGKPVLSLKGEIVGANGSSTLRAGAGGTLALRITNAGQATAHDAILLIEPAATLKDVSVVRADTLDDIKPGETRTEKIPLGVPDEAPSQKGTLAVTINADPGQVTAVARVDVAVRDVPYPKLAASLAAPQGGFVGGGTVRLRLRVSNTGTGDARGVSASIAPDSTGGADRARVRAMDRPVKSDIGALRAGTSRDIPVDVHAGADATGTAFFVVTLTEAREKFGRTDTLSVPVLSASEDAEAQGFNSFRRGDYRRAAEFFEKVAASGKASKDVYYALGVSYSKMQNRSRSLSVMQRASSLGSEDAKTWLAEHTTTVETMTVTYANRTADPFEGYNQPIGLGILPFTDAQMRNTPLTEKLYDALRKQNKAFRIFPFSTIQSEQTSLGLNTLAPSNREILAGLERDLSMNFAVGGSTGDTSAAVFTMQILRCRDGQMVYSQEFRTSRSSTAIDDAVLFLLQGKVPLYTRSHGVEVKLR